MANVKLRLGFKEKLELDQVLEGIVKKTLGDFGEILTDNKLYFFPEYTNHGIKHIDGVIASTNNLIKDTTFSKSITENDIAFYVLSVRLHDIGMHLDIDGFDYLINGGFDDSRIDFFDKLSWKNLWDEYTNESKRFSGTQLKAIFGDENTVVRVPPISKRGEINENDKKLIGEFIRRYHPRLAHEMALKGFPGKPALIEFANGLSREKKDLVGVIARSHGLDLRLGVDYLEVLHGKNGKRYPFNSHPVYLMVLLRVSDYIQIDSSRTSGTLLKSKTFSSPVSELEHNAHLAIDYIDDKYQDDPERIYVTASPKDSKMFLKLKHLIKSIQYEFDISWAVLGEVFGQHSDKLEIKYRRITSNLDDIKFVRKQEYVADIFHFKANDEITKLLIAPLYGDDPKYGVRELLQNAIDACKEREEVERRIDNLAYNPLITVEIRYQDNPHFIVTDNGIGMDIDVIKNYLLSAGASYRKSMEWLKTFQDEKGNTVIRRSGRFGVGILAAFLIGHEIYIETKKIGQKVGYKFHTDLQTDQINILKDENVNEGTTIKIRINKDALTQLERKEEEYNTRLLQWFKWFTLSSPTIKYKYFERELIPYSQLDPDINNVPIEWNAIESAGFNKILWTYNTNFTNADFTCNGIVIPHDNYRPDNILDTSLFSRRPKLSIFDNNAFAPISLDRNSFSSRLPFEHELVIDIFKDYLAYLLAFEKISSVDAKSIRLINNDLHYPGCDLSYGYYDYSYGFNLYDFKSNASSIIKRFIDKLLVSKEGFIVDYNYFINKIKTIDVVFIQSSDFAMTDSPLKIDLKDKFLSFTTQRLNAIPDYVNAIEPRKFDYESSSHLAGDARIFLKSDKYKYLFASKRRVSNWLNDRCVVKFDKFGWTCFHLENPKDSVITERFLKANSGKINFIREYELQCFNNGNEIFDSILQKYLGDDVVIPYSIQERKEKYPLAFDELNRYMKKYLRK